MPDGLRHEALPYGGVDGFVPACCAVVRDGLTRDDRLIVLAGATKLADVRDALGSDADEVTLVPLDHHGRNPSRVTTMLHSFQAGSDGRRCTGVNESVLSSRSPASLAEAQLSDFFLNDVQLAGWPMTVVCLYDTATLAPPVLDAMRQSHAVIRGEDRNPAYLPGAAATLWSAPLEPPPASAAVLVVGPTDLGAMREFVRQHAERAALDRDRADDLVLAANEIVTNSVRYGGGRAYLSAWTESDTLVCEVRDVGHLSDPLIGRFAPSPAATSGRGVWLAHHLCDLVQIRTSPAGTVVRLHMDATGS